MQIIYNGLIAVLLSLTIHQIEAIGCGPKFENKCNCGEIEFEGKVQYVVNCTNAGFRNTTVLGLMPEQTQVLIFTGNYITELPWNVFGEINDYSSLTVVDMSNNHIREIRGKSYHHVQNVRRLILNHNNLSISRDDDESNHHHPRVFSNFLNLESLHLTNAFADNTSAQLSEDLHDIFVNSNLTKLRKLHLEQNEISHFKDRKVFCDLPSLSDLHLGDNNLKEINFNVVCLKNLRFLDLERNKFDSIAMKDLNLLDALESRSDRTETLVVDFNINPFVCDCHIEPFQKWLKDTPVTVRNKEALMCSQSNKRIYEVEVKPCEPEPLTVIPGSSGHTAILIFLLVVLSFILVALLGTLAYLSRDKIKYVVSPVLDNVSKKVHYTTIKDEECPEVHV